MSNDKLLEMLKRLEWCKIYHYEVPIGRCPECDNAEHNGHKPDCELKSEIDRLQVRMEQNGYYDGR